MTFDFEEKATGFLVTLSYTEQKTSTVIKEGNKEGNKEGKSFSINQQAILKAIMVNPRITIPELSAIVGINEANIQKNEDMAIFRRIWLNVTKGLSFRYSVMWCTFLLVFNIELCFYFFNSRKTTF